MMKKILYISLLLLVVFSCKKDDPVEAFTTDLELVVVNQFGLPYANADVFLFDNKPAFDKAANNGNAVYLKTSKTDASGKVTFVNLDASVKYYFLAQSGGKSNENTDYTLKTNLVQGSVTTAVIELESLESFLVFWVDPQNASNLPIQIYVDGKVVDTLRESRNTEPTQGDVAKAVLVEVSPTTGNNLLKYKAVGSDGCYWEEQIAVNKAQFIPKKLNSCETGSVVFYSNSTRGITVTLSQTDEVGTITAITPVNKIPSCSNPEGGLVVERPKGTYLYKAVSGKCFWTGKIEITGGSCILEELKSCN